MQNINENEEAAACRVLGIAFDATEEQVRQAYLEQVRRHPPDRDPERFEQIRDAHQLLRDPKRRARQAVSMRDPTTPLTALLGDAPARRQFVGPELWLNVLKEKRA